MADNEYKQAGIWVKASEQLPDETEKRQWFFCRHVMYKSFLKRIYEFKKDGFFDEVGKINHNGLEWLEEQQNV